MDGWIHQAGQMLLTIAYIVMVIMSFLQKSCNVRIL